MADTVQTIQDYSEHIDWENLKDEYARLMMGREAKVEIEPHESRRRLTNRSLKKTKGRKRVPVMDYSYIHLKASSKKRGKSDKYSSMQPSKEYDTNRPTALVLHKSSKSKSGKSKKVGVPTNNPAPSKFKSAKSSKNKCRKIRVPVQSHEARRQRRTKARTSTKSGKGANSKGDGSLKTYKKKSKGKKVVKNKYENGKGGLKVKVPKSSSKSKSVKSSDSLKQTKSPKLSKSGKHKFVVVCDDDDEAPSWSPSVSAAPSISAAPSTSAAPSISASPFGDGNIPTISPYPTGSSVPSISPMPTTSSPPGTTISPSPSTSPSISHAPSLSNEPTEFGRTQPPSLSPSHSVSPSNQPSSRPSPKATDQPSQRPSDQPSPAPSPNLIPTISPRPTISSAPTLEDIYRYSSGNCPNDGIDGVPCSDPDLRKICDRYDEEFGSFRRCWELCTPSFCCIHDARNNFEAPSCSLDENCAQYAYCYIVWFKFHDTFGPATYLDVEQEGDFFNVPNSEVRGDDKFGQDFFDQLYFHHFDDVGEKIAFGTLNGEFGPARLFEDTTFWQEPGKGLDTEDE